MLTQCGGLFSKIPFNSLETKGYLPIVLSSGNESKEDRALLAVLTAVYDKPFLYNMVRKSNTFPTDG